MRIENKISIYVAYHKPSAMPEGSSFHIPIHVGRALSDQHIEGTIGDDTGHHISELNPWFCELTATYWAWKNDQTSDYIGLCHYRRFFTYRHSDFWSTLVRRLKFMKAKLLARDKSYIFHHQYKCTSDAQFKKEIQLFDARLATDIAKNSPDIIYLKPVRSVFKLEQTGGATYERTKQITSKYYPEFHPYVVRLLGSKSFSYANMVIMKRDIFDEYCSMLFGILEHHRQLSCNEREQERIYGYIAENLTAAFIEYKKAMSNITVRPLNLLFLK